MASQTLLQRLTEMIEQGVKFEISFEKKTLSVDNKRVISFEYGKIVLFHYKGKERLRHKYEWEVCNNPLYLGVHEADDTEQALDIIDGLYQIYKHSRPSERSDSKSSHSYFKALPESELSTDDMLYSIPREVARFRLEYHVLVYSMLGLLKWDDSIMGGKWFYKSPIDRDLIILRSWID